MCLHLSMNINIRFKFKDRGCKEMMISTVAWAGMAEEAAAHIHRHTHDRSVPVVRDVKISPNLRGHHNTREVIATHVDTG